VGEVCLSLAFVFFAEKPPQFLGASLPKIRLVFPRRKEGRDGAPPQTLLKKLFEKSFLRIFKNFKKGLVYLIRLYT